MSAKDTVNGEKEPIAIVTYDINIPYHDSDMEKPTINNPQYAPTWQPVWFDPLPEFDFTDPALRADKRKHHLLTPATVMENITPKMGTILRGVNLAYLSDEAKSGSPETMST